MLTIDTLTDSDIREIEVEAERERDLEAMHICRLAYRHDGRGNDHPLARARIVQWLDQRSTWAAWKAP